MSEITVNKKLELLKQIRLRNQRDRSDLLHREQILYGRTSGALTKEYYDPADEALLQEGETGTLAFRFMLAACLFLVIVLCDRSGRSILGLPTEKCFQAISTDYESSIAVWANAAFGKDSEDAVLENPPAGVRP